MTNIIRAITDEGVMAVIDLADKAALSNVRIVCTRSDDIEAGEAKRGWNDSLAQAVTVLQERLTEATRNLEELEEEINDYNKIDPDELLDEEKTEYMRLQRRASNAKSVKVQREFEYVPSSPGLQTSTNKRQTQEISCFH